MGDYRSHDRPERERFRGRKGSDRPMFQATCSNCGNACEVPFRPTGDRPVYCSKCFESVDKTGDNPRNAETREFNRSGSSRGSIGDKQMFDAVCSNCGKNCQIPFRPRTDKPVYCSSCFGDRAESREKSIQPQIQFKDQLNAINAKLDKILRTLIPAASPFIGSDEPKKTVMEEMKVILSGSETGVEKKETKKKARKNKPAEMAE